MATYKTFTDASDEELQVSAKFAGLDEKRSCADLILADEPLTARQRKTLISNLEKFGYTKVNVTDPNWVTAE